MSGENNKKITVGEAVGMLDETNAGKMRMLLERGSRFRPSPGALKELRRQLMQKEFDARVLARTINCDLGITALLFKVVGSAVHHQHQPLLIRSRVFSTPSACARPSTWSRPSPWAGIGDVKRTLAYLAFWRVPRPSLKLAMRDRYDDRVDR